MIGASLTDKAQEQIGSFVQEATETSLVLKCADALGDVKIITIRPEDLAAFCRNQSGDLCSGCRTLAGLVGDWRPVSELANAAMRWFVEVNPELMRQALCKVGLNPRF